jgi:hypothetical protein
LRGTAAPVIPSVRSTSARQHLGQHVTGVARLTTRTDEVETELPVREDLAPPVADVRGERGLADAGGPGDHHDGWRNGGRRVRHDLRELACLRLAAGEVGRVTDT